MNDLIQSCKSELDANLSYLRHPVDAISAVVGDVRREFRADTAWGLIAVAELVCGSVLFATVVVPLGVVGKLLAGPRRM